MSKQTLLQERVQLFRDTTQMKKTNRVPNVANFFTWKILDSEYKLSEAMGDWNKMYKLVCEFQGRYNFDAHIDLGTRNPISVTSVLGGNFYEIDDEKEIINIDDHIVMNGNEYKELNTNPIEFYWTKALPRKYPNITIENLREAMFEFIKFNEYKENINKTFIEEFQCTTLANSQYLFFHPYEILFNFLRGIKGMSMDLRKHKSEILETVEVQYEILMAPIVEAAISSDSSAYPFDMLTVFLGHSILSTKQFGEIYWPKLKTVIERLAEKGKTMYIFCESEMLRFYEFFQEIPKGTLAIHLEQDDIFDMRKKLPNICFAGGMTSDLLGNGTKQQCTDYAKKLIDEVGQDGGYIFSQNKMMSFRNDCKRENLLAVNEFVKNYRV
ncbi:MAG: uroporphyrinogen decarboxylase family protein [Eubacteriaceae bacterium]